MKYSYEVIIDKNIDQVINMFKDPNNLAKWQVGLKEMTLIQGADLEHRQKTKLVYDMNGKDVTMIETIELEDYPSTAVATYEAKNVWNRCDNHFEAKGDKTLWHMDTEFKCRGMMRLATMFGKKAFVNSTMRDMNAFKDFVENN